jgi:hypothetical protein
MKSCPNETIHGVTRELDTKQYLEEFLFFLFLFLDLGWPLTNDKWAGVTLAVKSA